MEIVYNTKNNKSSKPRIMISSYDDLKNPYYAGGGARAVHEVGRRLADQFEVTVLTSSYAGARNEIIDTVYYKRIGSCLLGARASQLVFHLVLPYYCLIGKYDIWIENFTPPFSTSCLPIFTKKPVIGLVHMLSGQEMRRKYKLPFDWIEYWGLRLYKNFIVPHRQLGQEIRGINRRARIGIIPNGVNLPDVTWIAQDKEYIIYVGRIEYSQKGIDLLLKAYSISCQHVPYQLVIAGTGIQSEVKKVRQLVEKLGLKDRVKIMGKLKHEQVFKLFNRSIMAVIPSRFETFSLVALEALACGLPVISFDIDGLDWLPSDVSLKVKPFDYQQLAEAIENLANDQDLRQELGGKARQFSKKYSWNMVANKYLYYLNDFK